MPAVYKLPVMEPIELLRTSVFKTTNNPDLTDVIIRIFEVAGDDTEVAMRSLGNLVGYEFAEFIMQLADIAFDRETALCIDPSYIKSKLGKLMLNPCYDFSRHANIRGKVSTVPVSSNFGA